MYIFSVKRAVQSVMGFESVVVCLSCIWHFLRFPAFFAVDVARFTHHNLVTLVLQRWGHLLVVSFCLACVPRFAFLLPCYRRSIFCCSSSEAFCK